MKNLKLKFASHMLLFLMISMIPISCMKEEEKIARDIEELITKAGVPEEVESSTDSVTLDQDYDFASNWLCKTIEVDATEARGDYRTFDPNSEIIWPGNLLQGASITKSTPDPIVVERAAGTFTINLINGSNSLRTQASVDQVNQSNVVSALNSIISSNSGSIPANFTYLMSEVESREQLAMSMGVNVSTLTADVNAKLSFSSDKTYNRFLVDFTQIYYTMIYEKPTSYEQVFAPSVTAADLAPYMSENNPPVYISSVTFGRRFYLLIESTSSVEKMKSSIKASYDAVVGGVDLAAGATYVTDLEEINIKIFAMGGDADAALGAFNGDISALQDYLQDGGDYFKAAPLSYVMTSLAPPQIQVGIGVTSKFTVQECTPLYDVAPPTFMQEWYNIFGSEGIGAATAIDPDQSNAYLFNNDGTQYAVSQNGEIKGIYEVADEGNHPLQGSLFDSIGSAVVYNNKTLYFFNMSGMEYSSLNNSGGWGGPHSLSLWSTDNQHPFREGATENPGAGGVLKYTGNRVIFFNRTGQRWMINDLSKGTFGSVFPISTWGGSTGPEWNIPFLGEGVGAALQVYTDHFIPAPNTGQVLPGKDFHQVLFNHAGTKVAVYHSSAGFSPVYDIVQSE